LTVLYAESFFPWCETARWALDHHRVQYRSHEHVPLFGEVALRLVARRPFGRVTVPLLVDGPLVLMDSVAIARSAVRTSSGDEPTPADSAARSGARPVVAKDSYTASRTSSVSTRSL
jgi:glutathione S-transferase